MEPSSSGSSTRSSSLQKPKRNQVVPRNITEIVGNDSSDKNVKDGFLIDVSSNKQKSSVLGPPEICYENYGCSDYEDGDEDEDHEEGLNEDEDQVEDQNEDDYYGVYDDESLAPIEKNDNLILAAKFDGLDLPSGVEAIVPWFQRTATESPTRKPNVKIDDEIDVKFKGFKQFDTVKDHSDHIYCKSDHFSAPLEVKKPEKEWVRRIQHEWKVLENDLPETILVRIYEDRMDILRAVIIGPAGTPYHDGLFFFDIYLPSTYPMVPPKVHYHSGGLRLNPNLYNSGFVCLSLLNTWDGQGCEKWNPSNSTILQVLVSIQALVLNAKPYYNEPGFESIAKSPTGEQFSLAYNREAFILSCKTMLYSLKRPPKHFEDFVAGHFRHRGRTILIACKAYMQGTEVGSTIERKETQDIDEDDKKASTLVKDVSSSFKNNLSVIFEQLLMEFTVKGADCNTFLAEKVKVGVQTAASSQAGNVS